MIAFNFACHTTALGVLRNNFLFKKVHGQLLSFALACHIFLRNLDRLAKKKEMHRKNPKHFTTQQGVGWS